MSTYLIEFDQENELRGVWPFSVISLEEVTRRNVQLMRHGIICSLIPIYQGTQEQCDALIGKLFDLVLRSIKASRLPSDEQIAQMNHVQLANVYNLIKHPRIDARAAFGAFDDPSTFKLESEHNNDRPENEGNF